MAIGTTITSVTDLLAVASQIIESAERDIVWLIPAPYLVFAAQFNLKEQTKTFIQNGGRSRGITTFSSPYIKQLRERLDFGDDVRHVSDEEELFMLVNDKRESVSAINTGTNDISLGKRIVAYWTDDPTYADYLLSSFEMAWEQSTDAEERIRELSEQESTEA